MKRPYTSCVRREPPASLRPNLPRARPRVAAWWAKVTYIEFGGFSSAGPPSPRARLDLGIFSRIFRRAASAWIGVEMQSELAVAQ